MFHSFMVGNHLLSLSKDNQHMSFLVFHHIMAAARCPSSSDPQLRETMDKCNTTTGNVGDQVRHVKYGAYENDMSCWI